MPINVIIDRRIATMIFSLCLNNHLNVVLSSNNFSFFNNMYIDVTLIISSICHKFSSFIDRFCAINYVWFYVVFLYNISSNKVVHCYTVLSILTDFKRNDSKGRIISHIFWNYKMSVVYFICNWMHGIQIQFK